MSERAQRKAAVGSGTAEAVTVTCKSTLDVRMSIHDKWGLPDQADSRRVGPGKGVLCTGTYLCHTRI